MKKYLKKISLLAIAFALVACGSVKVKLIVDDSNEPIKELHKEYTGEPIEISLSDIVENLSELDASTLLEKTVVNATILTYDENQTAEESTSVITVDTKEDGTPFFTIKDLGTYTLDLIYNKQEYKIDIIVEDTTAPIIEGDNDRIEIEYDSTKEDILSQVKADDLFTTTLDFDDSSIDYKTSGEYPITLTAIDLNGNTTTKEYTIVVKEEVVVEKEAPSNNGNNVNNNGSNTNNNSNSGGSGTTTPPTPPTPPVCNANGQWKRTGNSGVAFYNFEEAMSYGNKILDDDNSVTWYGFDVLPAWDICGVQGYTVDFF